MRYVPAHELHGLPHVIADGAPRPGTVFTLSHWPSSPTPRSLWADLSAEIAVGAISHPEALPPSGDLHIPLEVASLDHYDIDGVVTLALLCDPSLAENQGDLLVEVARVGDFGVVRDPRAAILSFSLAAIADPVLSPLADLRGDRRPTDPLSVCAIAASEALRILPDLLHDPEPYRSLWSDEQAAYEASRRAFDEGWATIEEISEHDLAIVRLDPYHRDIPAARWGGRPLHPAAVSSSTRCLRILTLVGARADLRYRYESWVRIVSFQPRPRVELTQLAEELTSLESGGSQWIFEGASRLTGALRIDEGKESSLSDDLLVERITDHLGKLDQKVRDGGPPAWDPWR